MGLTDDMMKRYFLGDEVVDSVNEERAKHPPSWHPNYIDYRVIGDGRSVWIYRKIFTWAITVGKTDDGFGYEDHWCYETEWLALHALDAWATTNYQGEPQGWIRNPRTGRRREHGDKTTEYVSS